MSSRHIRRLRELQKKEEAAQEPPVDVLEDGGSSSGSDVAPQTQGNLFALLDSSDSEDDSETEEKPVAAPTMPAKPATPTVSSDVAEQLEDPEKPSTSSLAPKSKPSKSKRRRKKKNKKKKRTVAKDDQDDILALAESIALIGSNATAAPLSKPHPKSALSSLLHVQRNFLVEENELRRRFGRDTVKSNQTQPVQRKKKGRRRQVRASKAKKISARRLSLVTPDPEWPAPPTRIAGGLGMEIADGTHACGISMHGSGGSKFFKFVYSEEYAAVDAQFTLCTQTLQDPSALMQLVQVYPHHCSGLIQLSDMMRQLGRMEESARALRRCLFVFQFAFHPLFNYPTQRATSAPSAAAVTRPAGTPRLRFDVAANKPFFEVLFRHLMFLLRRGCPRTALEVAKMLLSLDPDLDPMGVLLCIGVLAVRAREHEWLLQCCDPASGLTIGGSSIAALPGMAFSKALALGMRDGYGAESACAALQRALAMFPNALRPLARMAKLPEGSAGKQWQGLLKHPFWGDDKACRPVSIRLAAIMAEMQHDLWAAPKTSAWLLESAMRVLSTDVARRGTEKWRDMRAAREVAHQLGAPVQRYMSRNAYDYSEKTGQLPAEMLAFQRGGRAAAPQPPLGPAVDLQNRNPLALFLETLLPWNRIQLPPPGAAAWDAQGDNGHGGGGAQPRDEDL